MIDTLIYHDQQLLLNLNGCNSPFFDRFFFAETSLIAWLPTCLLLIFLIWRRQSDWKPFLLFVVLISLTILFADQISSGIIKPLVARWRPTRDPQLMNLVHTVNDYRGGRYGFVSSHAANSSAIATIVLLLFRDKATALILYVWSLLFAYSRIYLGVHYPLDILGGFVVGAASAALVYAIYRLVIAHYSNLTLKQLHKKDALYLASLFLLNLLSLFVYAWLSA